MRATVRIGTSGWSYDAWQGPFYPEDLGRADFLAHYARVFDTVEINSSFYRTPSEKAVKRWHQATPRGFLFTIKGSRYITHNLKLKNAERSLALQREALEGLQAKRGPILWQLSAKFKRDIPTLESFLALREPHERWAIECRHESWFCDDVYQLLRSHACALVWADTPFLPLHVQVTADFLYARLHGHETMYGSEYSPQQLGWWKARLRRSSGGKRDIFVYFDNDLHGHAPKNALQLKEMMTQPEASQASR